MGVSVCGGVGVEGVLSGWVVGVLGIGVLGGWVVGEAGGRAGESVDTDIGVAVTSAGVYVITSICGAGKVGVVFGAGVGEAQAARNAKRIAIGERRRMRFKMCV